MACAASLCPSPSRMASASASIEVGMGELSRRRWADKPPRACAQRLRRLLEEWGRTAALQCAACPNRCVPWPLNDVRQSRLVIAILAFYILIIDIWPDNRAVSP